MGTHDIGVIAQRAARRYRAGSELASTGLRRPPRASFAHGAAGIAYFLFRRARLGKDPEALADASVWVAIAEREVDRAGAFLAPPGHPSFPHGRRPVTHSLYLGEPGVWCVAALVKNGLSDAEGIQRALERYAAIADTSVNGALDVFLGTAGLLIGAALLTEDLDETLARPLLPVAERLVTRLTDAVVEHDRSGSGPEFLGAAHGWAGIAHALLLWSHASGTDPGSVLTGLLERLRDARLPDGLWPRRADSPEIWPGWCHGSAGWVQVWTLAEDVLDDRDLLELAVSPGSHAVRMREREGAGMCCGRAGEGFAALALYRSTGEDAWLAHARRIVEISEESPVGPSFPEDSVWRGDLGVALLALDVEHPTRAAMPLYRAVD